MMPELSVVLPCYNEAGNIRDILERFRPLARQADLELILVDNGSTDGSAEVFTAELARPDNAFARCVKIERNIGYGHGVQTGLEQARAPVVCFSHADLQCPPEDVLEAYALYRKKDQAASERSQSPADFCRGLLVKGRRSGRPLADSLVTWSYNHLAKLVLGLQVVPITLDGQEHPPRAADINAMPKLFARELIPASCGESADFTYDLYLLELCRRKGVKILEFDVRYESRKWGKSKLAANPWVRLKTSLNALRRILLLRLVIPTKAKPHPGESRDPGVAGPRLPPGRRRNGHRLPPE
ncbi:MAG: glycosyltransferase family 2 protein [Elusimicrobiota bacterium]|jgi:glycosyltransferase involved in cell wall biosynthesis